MVGVKGATPHCRRSQAAKYFLAPAGAALEALRKGEFCGGKPQKRKSLQGREFLPGAKLLLSYRDKGKVRQKRATGTFLRDDFDVIATRRSGRVRFSSETCRFPHLFLRFFRQGVFRPLRRAPQGLCPQDPHQRGHCPLWKPVFASLTL